MTNQEFLNLDLAKELILYDIFDVDEFVLSEANKIKKNNLLDVWDVSKARRYCFEIYRIGEDEYDEVEISLEEYWLIKEHGGFCFTRLNYEDFEKDFPLDELDQWYDDEWLYDFHFNKAFFKSAVEWITKTEGECSKS